MRTELAATKNAALFLSGRAWLCHFELLSASCPSLLFLHGSHLAVRHPWDNLCYIGYRHQADCHAQLHHSAHQMLEKVVCPSR